MFKQKPIFSVYPTVNRSELKRDKKKQTKEKQPNGFCLWLWFRYILIAVYIISLFSSFFFLLSFSLNLRWVDDVIYARVTFPLQTSEHNNKKNKLYIFRLT